MVSDPLLSTRLLLVSSCDSCPAAVVLPEVDTLKQIPLSCTAGLKSRLRGLVPEEGEIGADSGEVEANTRAVESAAGRVAVGAGEGDAVRDIEDKGAGPGEAEKGAPKATISGKGSKEVQAGDMGTMEIEDKGEGSGRAGEGVSTSATPRNSSENGEHMETEEEAEEYSGPDEVAPKTTTPRERSREKAHHSAKKERKRRVRVPMTLQITGSRKGEVRVTCKMSEKVAEIEANIIKLASKIAK